MNSLFLSNQLLQTKTKRNINTISTDVSLRNLIFFKKSKVSRSTQSKEITYSFKINEKRHQYVSLTQLDQRFPIVPIILDSSKSSGVRQPKSKKKKKYKLRLYSTCNHPSLQTFSSYLTYKKKSTSKLTRKKKKRTKQPKKIWSTK